MRPIEQIWQDLLGRGRSAWPVYQRIDETHPIDFYAGITADGVRLLMLLSTAEPQGLPSFHAFNIIKALREDNRWTISVELRRSELANIFGHLCDDLIEASRAECRPEEAAAYLVARILRWQRLLGRDRTGLLDMNEIRGLIGELVFLKNVSCVEKGLEAGVRSWEGCLDAPQDFRFEDRFVEVKTCGPSSLVVWISSAEQLDLGVMPIVLSVVVIEAADELVAESFTLASLVAEVRRFLEPAATACAAFNNMLQVRGYVDRDEYTKDRFAFRKFRHFYVSDRFPKIERRAVPDAIKSVTYQLDLAECRAYERENVWI